MNDLSTNDLLIKLIEFVDTYCKNYLFFGNYKNYIVKFNEREVNNIQLLYGYSGDSISYTIVITTKGEAKIYETVKDIDKLKNMFTIYKKQEIVLCS